MLSEDLDVVGVSGDAVGAERPDDVRALGSHEPFESVDELRERHLGESAVVVPKPEVPVRRPAEHLPRAFVLLPADRAERLRGRREVGMDVAGSAVGGMHQDVPEPRVVSVQGDGAGHPVSVVVRVGDDHHQRQPASHPPMIG